MRVLDTIARFAAEHCGCDPEMVEMTTTLDELNITSDELSELAVVLEEQYMVELTVGDVDAFETVEDIVGYVEDRM